MDCISPTLSLGDAARNVWPVVVVGAGPAGAIAAHEIARRGERVLLVDKAEFPRGKVCGGCLGAAAVQVLEACGLGEVPFALSAVPIRELHIVGKRAKAKLEIDGGFAVSRSALDAALIRKAMEQGTDFLPGTSAHLSELHEDSRELELRSSQASVTIRTECVVAADGLAGTLAKKEESLRPEVDIGSRIGLWTEMQCDADAFVPGVVTMVYGGGGYVGLVRLEDKRLNVAAAVDPAYVRTFASPAASIAQLLAEAGLDAPLELANAHWIGTPPLTRARKRVAAERLLLIGDAAGYVEPFTGEGMSWAMAAARAVVPFAMAAGDDPRIHLAWDREYQRLIRRRQWVCRFVAGMSRSTWAAGLAVSVLSHMPWLAQPFVREVQRAG